MADALEDRLALADAGSHRSARRLAVVGLGPFVILSLWLIGIDDVHPWREATILLLKSWSALVLAFLGGARFGLAAARTASGAAVLATAVPVLAAWLALVMTEPHSFALLAVAFAAHGAWDSFAAHAGTAPDWYGRLRRRLTVPVVAALVLAFLATA